MLLQKIFKTKSLIKSELTRITIPVFIDLALVILLGAVDTFMLSRYSDEAVAAVGLDNQLVNLVFLVYQFVSMGAAILCAQYYGAGERKRFTQVVFLSLMLNAGIGLLMSLAMWVWTEQILTIMGLRAQLMGHGLVYLKITGSLSFFQSISLLFSAVLRSTNRTLYPMLATLAANIINILANYALIFGNWGCPAMGVEGAAWATAGSRIISMLVLASFLPTVFKQKNNKYTIISVLQRLITYFKPFPKQELRNLIYVGIPSMSEELSYCLSQVAITYFINKLSNDALAARAYCFTVITFVIICSQSIVQGGSILVGHYVGQFRYRAAYILGNYIYSFAMKMTLVMATIVVVAGHSLMSFLTDNETVIYLGTWIFAIDWFLDIGRVRNIFSCGTLRAAGDTVYPVVIGVIFQWSIAVGVSYVLGIPLGFGLLGMWIGFALDENVRGIILLRRWRSLKWQGKSFV